MAAQVKAKEYRGMTNIGRQLLGRWRTRGGRGCFCHRTRYEPTTGATGRCPGRRRALRIQPPANPPPGCEPAAGLAEPARRDGSTAVAADIESPPPGGGQSRRAAESPPDVPIPPVPRSRPSTPEPATVVMGLCGAVAWGCGVAAQAGRLNYEPKRTRPAVGSPRPAAVLVITEGYAARRNCRWQTTAIVSTTRSCWAGVISG